MNESTEGRELYPMGDRGGTATQTCETLYNLELYPMGDRGGTATPVVGARASFYYTRWEIGGEPQRDDDDGGGGVHYTRWEIGGEPQPSPSRTASRSYYTRWEIGGEPQHPLYLYRWLAVLYPMGDRGGTATH